MNHPFPYGVPNAAGLDPQTVPAPGAIVLSAMMPLSAARLSKRLASISSHAVFLRPFVNRMEPSQIPMAKHMSRDLVVACPYEINALN